MTLDDNKCYRIYPKEDGHLYFPPGIHCYGKDKDGMWWFKHKNTHGGTLFGSHEVFEHDDGTITVSPSIVGPGIHGFVEHGVWRDC